MWLNRLSILLRQSAVLTLTTTPLITASAARTMSSTVNAASARSLAETKVSFGGRSPVRRASCFSYADPYGAEKLSVGKRRGRTSGSSPCRSGHSRHRSERLVTT